MSIASEITRLQQAKADIKTAIENKGVTVPSDATLDDYADLVDSISGGGGSVDWESIARGMCDGVTEFEIPAEVGLDGLCVCSDRKGLKSAVIASGTGTAQNLFYNCKSLLSATINGSISVIRNYSFRGATSLREVIIEATTPPTLGTGVFQYIDTSQLTIYVPDASVTAYQSATNWTTYASKIKGISERPTT